MFPQHRVKALEVAQGFALCSAAGKGRKNNCFRHGENLAWNNFIKKTGALSGTSTRGERLFLIDRVSAKKPPALLVE